jgi:hypothetical protein
MGGGVPGLPFTMPGLSMVADFVDELWIKATGAARVKGMRAAVGLAIHDCLSRCVSCVAGIEFHVPRRPRAIVERVAANMLTLVGRVYGRRREIREAEWRLWRSLSLQLAVAAKEKGRDAAIQ